RLLGERGAADLGANVLDRFQHGGLPPRRDGLSARVSGIHRNNLSTKGTAGPWPRDDAQSKVMSLDGRGSAGHTEPHVGQAVSLTSRSSGCQPDVPGESG